MRPFLQWFVIAPITLLSSRTEYVDKALLVVAPVNHQYGGPAPGSRGRESDVERAAGTYGKHRRAIICGSEALPLTWRAIHSAANRLWHVAGVGHSGRSRGAGCTNHLIAELNSSRVH
jgi:hypothetical protein